MLKDNATRIGLLVSMIGMVACSQARDREMLVRFLVYNIHAGKDARGVDNLERVAGIIRESQADIVLLQEVDRLTTRSGNVDQIARLKELTGFEGVFGKTIDWQGGEYGIAVLSRWRIGADRMIRLSVDPLRPSPSFEQRGALVVNVMVPAGIIRVINSHLDASHADSFRIQQARHLIDISLPRTRVSSIPEMRYFTFVGGDFNAEPTSGAYSVVQGAGFQDAFEVCGKGNALTFPDDKPVKRIDYLFLEPKTSCREARVIDTQASDHRPLLVRIGIPPRSF